MNGIKSGYKLYKTALALWQHKHFGVRSVPIFNYNILLLLLLLLTPSVAMTTLPMGGNMEQLLLGLQPRSTILKEADCLYSYLFVTSISNS